LFIAVWLSIVGVDFPVLWGVIAFMLNFVPTIGSIIAAVPTVLLSLVQLGVDSSLFVLLGYFLVNINQPLSPAE
jgi:predicted PurR-regulated permease PerM